MDPCSVDHRRLSGVCCVEAVQRRRAACRCALRGPCHSRIRCIVHASTVSRQHSSHLGNLGIVRDLLETDQGLAALLQADEDGRMPLHWAATSDDKLELVEALLGAGEIPLDDKDHSGWTPLMIAASAGARRIVSLLIARYVCCILMRQGSRCTCRQSQTDHCAALRKQ